MSYWVIEIIHNLAVLFSLGLLFYLLHQWVSQVQRLNRLLFGVICGLVGILVMATAFVYQPGVLFDTRTIVLTLAGLFGGGTGGLVAMILAGSYRLIVGGLGMWAGLATIVAAGLTGIVGRWLIRRVNWPPTLLQLWGVGLAAHLLAVLCFFLLPEPVRLLTQKMLSVPFLLIYPLVVVISGSVVVIFGSIMVREEGQSRNLKHLRHAEWLFNEAQKATRFGSWEYRLDTDRFTATSFFYELLGIRDDTRPLSLQDFFGRLYQEDWDSIRLSFDEAIRGGAEIDVQGRLRTDDGRELWIRIVGKPIIVREKVVQLVGNLIDITKRKTAELQLRASEERLQAIIDHAHALICLCDLEGRVTLANRRLEAFGTAASPIIGQPLYELLPREAALEQWLDDMMALRAGEHIEFEETLRHADGQERTYLVNKVMLDSVADRPDLICYIATDVTELRGALAELQERSKELRSKNSELERFSYIISHDLKGPLLTIGSYTDLVRENLAAGDREQALVDLGCIRLAVDKMRQLIDDLLHYSLIGQTTGNQGDVDLNETVEEVLLLLAGEIRKAGAEIITAPNLPVVRGDATQLRQVLQNLLQNALKYRVADRPLVIQIFASYEKDDHLLISVSDNGRGIDDKDRERIFDLFERVGAGGEGAGIGLALARRIMQAHGGDLRAEPADPDAGSRFVMQLPASPAAATLRPTADGSGALPAPDFLPQRGKNGL